MWCGRGQICPRFFVPAGTPGRGGWNITYNVPVGTLERFYRGKYPFRTRNYSRLFPMRRKRTLLLEGGLILATIVLTKALDFPTGYAIAAILAVAFLVAWYMGKDENEEEFSGSSLFGSEGMTLRGKPEYAGVPNVMFGNAISIQKVVEDSGRFRLFVPNESADFLQAITIEAVNPAIDGQTVASAGQVKAQLCFQLKQGDYPIAPGAWLDEPYSSVRLDAGDTRRLIIAVSKSLFYDWQMVSNKRTGPDDHISLDHSRDVPLSAEGILEVKLISSGQVLRTLRTNISWPWQRFLQFAGLEQF